MAHSRCNGSFFGPATLVELLRHRAAHQADERAFTYLVDGERHEQHWTYGQLDRQAQRIAAGLQQGGAARHGTRSVPTTLVGQRVLLLFPPGLDYIAALFGCAYAGAVAVPAYPPRLNRKLDQLRAIAADAKPCCALTTRAVRQQVESAAEECHELRTLNWLATDDLPEAASAGAPWQEPHVTADTLALLQYTSGSTADPKGVMLTHANLIHNSALIAHAFEHTRSGVGVFWLPGYHDMGLIGGILQPVYMGRPNILMSPMAFLQRPARWLEAISRYGATSSGGPNFAYELCLQKVSDDDMAGLDLSRWRVAFNGAEPIRAETLAAFADRFGRCGFRPEAFYPCYGLAEATLLAAGGVVGRSPSIRQVDARALEEHRVEEAAADSPEGKAVIGCGGSLPDQEIAIVDPARLVRCADGQVGEIWLRGPSIAQGYWRREAETAETFAAHLAGGEATSDEAAGDEPSGALAGPYLRTGDLGFLADGELFVTGRLKDLIIVRGKNHYPHDIERTAELSHPALGGMAGAAFTIDVENEARLVVVHEIQRARRQEAPAAIASLRREVLTEHELAPAVVVLVRPGHVPKTTSGKIRRGACRQAFLAGDLAEFARDDSAARAAAERIGQDRATEQEPAQPRGSQAPRRRGHQPRAAVRDVSATTRGGARLRLHASFEDADAAADGGAAADRSGTRVPSYSDRLAVFDADSLQQQVLAEVRRIARPSPGARVSLDSALAEVGLDSLGRMELLAALECRLGVRLPEAIGPQPRTIRDVAEAVHRWAANQTAEVGLASCRAGVEIPSEDHDVARFPEWVALQRDAQSLDSLRLDSLRVDSLGAGNPYFQAQETLPGRRVRVAGRELIDFASYDYLGLATDPRVSEAAKRAIERYGTSVSGSRLVAGERALHQELEQTLAGWIGAEEALVFVSGHATNVTTIGHVLGPQDLVLHDELAHNSIVQGCRLSGARRLAFPHNDAEALDRLLTSLRGNYRRALVGIEGLYSMDGDVPDLPRFIEIKRRHKALLMVDEAHSLGVLGERGRGIGEQFHAAAADVDLWMGTLSKALASCGGYIAGRRELVEYLKYTAPGFVYSVGMSPANAAAALEALRVLEAEPLRVRTLQERAEAFVRLARQRGLDIGTCQGTPVVPILIGETAGCLQLWQRLVDRGILAQPILPPAVPAASSRLRFFVTATHSPRQIREAVEAIAEELQQPAGQSLRVG